MIDITLSPNLVLLQTTGQAAAANERLSVVLGWVTLVCGIAIFLSCRSCLSWASHLGSDLLKLKGYSAFYKFHIYYWWALGVFLVAHLMVAIIHTGLPTALDPNANIHWAILGLGLFSGLIVLAIFFSCRLLPRLTNMAWPESRPNNNSIYRIFFNNHSYFWLILAVPITAHVVIGLLHSGVWP